MEFLDQFYTHGNNLDVWLFNYINGIRAGAFYDQAMIFMTRICERSNFPIYLIIFILCGVWQTRQAKTRHMIEETKWQWITVVGVFVIAFLADWLFLHIAKDFF